jgi:hypothetical protein
MSSLPFRICMHRVHRAYLGMDRLSRQAGSAYRLCTTCAIHGWLNNCDFGALAPDLCAVVADEMHVTAAGASIIVPRARQGHQGALRIIEEPRLDVRNNNSW